jgi:hypothetical protein
MTCFVSMGKELLLEQPSQAERNPEIETEIECPRCYDTMVLSSDFDKLYYFCEECNLSLRISNGDLALWYKFFGLSLL